MPSFLPINNVFTSALRGGPNIITQGLVGLGLLPPEWGIFDNKTSKSVVTFSTVKSVEYRQDWSVSDYPVERGAFESYNKVQTPYEARVTFVAGGFGATQDLLDSVAAIVGTLKLYDVVTPERTFTKANVTHWDFRRAMPIGICEVSVHLVEIRNNVSSSLSTSARQPEGSGTADGGQAQPEQVPVEQQQLVIDAFNAPVETNTGVGGGGAG